MQSADVYSTARTCVPVPLALRHAYESALYEIGLEQPIVLQIGQAHPALRARFPQGGVFLTACNPRSRRLRPAANARRMRALRQIVERMGHDWLPGRGLDPHGLWPDEPSLWIPNLPRAEGLRLARRFGQYALVWCGPDSIAHLGWVSLQSTHIC